MKKEKRPYMSRKALILRFIESCGSNGATVEQIAAFARMPPDNVQTRLSNYKDVGDIFSAGPTGRRRIYRTEALMRDGAPALKERLAAEDAERSIFVEHKTNRINTECVRQVLHSSPVPLMTATIAERCGLSADAVRRSLFLLRDMGQCFFCGMQNYNHYATTQRMADAFDDALFREREQQRQAKKRAKNKARRVIREDSDAVIVGKVPERPKLKLPDPIIKSIDGITLISATAPAGRYEADPSEVGGFSSLPIGVYTEPAGWSANVIGRSA